MNSSTFDQVRRKSISDAISLSQGKLNYKRIKDQNGDWDPDVLWNSKKDYRPYHWMRDDKREAFQWLYTRVQAHEYGKADVSDAGLMYWLPSRYRGSSHFGATHHVCQHLIFFL
ncbi:MAG: hypothetical protein AB8B55_12655 [Mariniblastus sp.]